MPIKSETRADQKLREVLTDTDTYASVLITILIDKFGTECLEWAPETIRLEIHDEFQCKVPDDNLDKIMAAISLLVTDDFYQNLPRFVYLCNCLAGSGFDPLVFDPADSWEIAWAITEAMMLAPPEDLENAFSDEIRRYIGETLKYEGIIRPPDILGIAIIEGHVPDPAAAFADDPELYADFWNNQQSHSDEITTMLRENLQDLLRQVSSLPLSNGSAEDLMTKMRRSTQ